MDIIKKQQISHAHLIFNNSVMNSVADPDPVEPQ